MGTVDFRTETQKKRDGRHAKIYGRYMEIKDMGASKYQIFRVLSGEFGITPQAIEYVVRKMKIN